MTVTLSHVKPRIGESVWVGEGFRVDGAFVVFVGDWRPMSELKGALESGIPVEVEVEDHQLLYVGEA